ncbi:MAG TPA: 23S rRNA (adenine(2503)-C(2))-methyltransferase RlmN [Thermoanaerobaculia bacterium]|nr:23S rRNA (adenine(2503)-C(2))-methyltransferase RlmN [Thermoanaerobaculia bacterium]
MSHNLLGHPLEALRRELSGVVDHRYRADQVHAAIHRRGVADFEAMSDLPSVLRAALAERYSLARPVPCEVRSSDDGTTKYLFELEDGAGIEAVDIPDGDRRTLCLSSQAGCALACRFCVTGYWGAGRDLTAAEIVGQVMAIRERGGLEASRLNLVYMGMGEPLLNLQAVRESLLVLSETIAWRRITVSTAGVVPGIEEMARWPQRPNLAISLHAPDDERRNELMPINRRYPLDRLFAALAAYPTSRHRPLTFEYTVIRGFNDRVGDLRAVARRLAGLRAKINLIPLNPDPVLGDLAPPSWEVMERLQREVAQRGVPCSVRRPRGDDVQAACGQLRAFARAPRGFETLAVADAARGTRGG